MMSADTKGLESYATTKEELKKAGETLEKNLATLFYLTEGDSLKFTVYDEHYTKIRFRTKKKGLLVIEACNALTSYTVLYDIRIKRNSPKTNIKRLKNGLATKALDIRLVDFQSNKWWSWEGSIDEVFAKYAEGIFGERGHNINDQINRLISLQTSILKHFEKVEEKKTSLIEKLKEADSKFGAAVNVVSLYSSNAEQFKGIFAFLPLEKQKEVLNEIIKKGLRNEKADKWLGKEYPKLINLVGRDRYIFGEGKDGKD